MRIAYLSGLWLHDLWFLGHLSRAGHEILSIRAYRSPNSYEASALDGLPHVRHLERTSWFAEVRQAGEVPELGMARRLRALLDAEGVELLQAGWLSDGGVLAALSGFHPLVLTPFGSDVLLSPYRCVESRLRKRWALRCADAISVDCAAVARRIEALAGFPFDRIVRFAWGIDLDRFRADAPAEPFRERLGWTGRTVVVCTRSLEPVYGVDVLLEAFAKARARRPESALLLIGDGTRRAELEAQARSLGLGDAVRFQGRVPNADLPRWLAGADLYVSASRSDGTSRSLMEAMACGLPAVVTDVPANLEWVREGVHGAVARRGDPEDLAAALLRVLEAPDRAAMRQACRETAREHFDEARNVAKLEGIYAALRRGEPPPPLGSPGRLPPWDPLSPPVDPPPYTTLKGRLAEWMVIAELWRNARFRARRAGSSRAPAST